MLAASEPLPWLSPVRLSIHQLTASFRLPQMEIFKPALAAKIVAYGAGVTWAGMNQLARS